MYDLGGADLLQSVAYIGISRGRAVNKSIHLF